MPDTLLPAALVCAGIIAGCWLLSLVTREYSWTDRMWATAPPIYAWMFASAGGWHPRGVLVATLITLWGARLTFNFWRKGGFRPGGEDYRWKVLRDRMPAWAYQVFNVLFIAGYQNVLVFLFTLPAWVIVGRDTPLGALDVGLTVLFLGALAGETVADEQQWRFHVAKSRGESPTRFLTTGLWRWSRHPNYFFEQAQWWIVLLFSVAAGAGVWHIGSVGAPLLTLLFIGSAKFTEWISAGKYPEYADYQRRTSMMLPSPPRG